MAWKKITWTTEDELIKSLSDIATLAVRDEKGELQIVGSAFPIISSMNQIVMLSARHVIEEAYQRVMKEDYRKLQRLNYLPGEDNTLNVAIDDWMKQTSDFVCIILHGGSLLECKVIAPCLRPPLDMALLVVDASRMKERYPVFAINSDPLTVGDEIVTTFFVTKGSERILEGRSGIVTEVKAKGPLANAPVYETNIPTASGSSGGPVFRYNGKFCGEKEVVGVISSGFSSELDFCDQTIDGLSHVAMICSAAPLQMRNENGDLKTFKEMCEKGYGCDRGEAIKSVSVTYKEDGNRSQAVPVGRRR